MPNPAFYYFTLDMQSASKEKIKVIVSDVTGRVVEQINDILANSILQIGDAYPSGVYIAEILQGKERVTLRLIIGK